MVRAWGRSMKLQGWGNVWRVRREAQGSLAPTLGGGVSGLAPKPVQQDRGGRTRLVMPLIPWLRELARLLQLWPFVSALSLTLGFPLLSAPQCPPASSEKS